MKSCSQCRRALPEAMFYKNIRSPTGLQAYCKDCQRTSRASWRLKNPGRDSGSARRLLYGLEPEEFDRLVAVYDGCCHLCRKKLRPGRWTHVDHDHATGRTRGVLCRPCNVALGALGDNEAGLLAALAYLRGEVRP